MIYALIQARNMIELVILGAIVGFFANGMYGGYGAIMTYLYPADISATANNLIMNVGKAVGSFSTIVIGFLMRQVFNECRNGLLIGDVIFLSFVCNAADSWIKGNGEEESIKRKV